MLHIMSVELVDLTGFSAPIGQEEFDRAKNQLRSGIHPFAPHLPTAPFCSPPCVVLNLAATTRRHLHELGAASGVVRRHRASGPLIRRTQIRSRAERFDRKGAFHSGLFCAFGLGRSAYRFVGWVEWIR